ncbi:MAG: Spy/CpxP family protein refolding chaperone [Oceanospirillaceae bacterium]|nr:Spy/CpxP family protein refolding chaperone [Oceanospirillaceae bacterium]
MNKSIKRALIIIPSIALAGVFATGAVMADGKDCKRGNGHDGKGKQSMGHKGGKKGGMMAHRMAKKLDLTDAQQDAIKDIMQAQHQDASGQHQAMAAALAELAQLEAGSDAYIAKAKAIGAIQGDAMAQRLINKADVEQQVQALLTPEQLKKYQTMHAAMAERRAERMQKHHNNADHTN